MPMDETTKLQNEAAATAPTLNVGDIFHFIQNPVYNIDDVDHSLYMRDHRMEGVYVIFCEKAIDEDFPGQFFVDGSFAGEAMIMATPLGEGCHVAFSVRRFIREYGKNYNLRYTGAKTLDGEILDDFSFDLTALPKKEPGEIYPEHDDLVLNAAVEGMVLLRNENNVLPLKKDCVINAFGKGGPVFRLGCVGAGKINPRYGIRFEEGIEKYSSLHLNHELFEFYRQTESYEIPPSQIMENALELSDTAVIVITRGTGESMDNRPYKGEYYLTDEEEQLLQYVSNSFNKVVVILNIGYPIEMGWVDRYSIDAVLWCGLAGMAAGKALAQILDGTSCPSGRLPDTWSYDYYDIPASKNFYIQDGCLNMFQTEEKSFITTVYEEGLYVGYRYFETFKKERAYPFGHGLSYTTFEKQCVSVDTYKTGGRLKIKVTNTGNMFGKETVLLFAKLPENRLEQPAYRLVAFGKTHLLAPGASEYIVLSVDSDDLKSYDEERAAWIIEAGKIGLYLGGSVAETEYITDISVEEEIIVTQVKNRVYPAMKIKELSKHDAQGTWPKGEQSGISVSSSLTYPRNRKKTAEKRIVSAKKPDEVITFPMVIENKKLLSAFVEQLTDYELCRISVGGRTGWNANDNGFAGMLYNEGALEKYEIPEYYMSDGNNGLNLYIASIGFPVSNMICATFNEDLIYEQGRALAKEAKDFNLQCLLAPAMNIHRNPLCGRHAEYFSEDPYLAGRMAGMQSKGIESMGIPSVMKHFAANNAENLRNYNHSIMSERTLREIYLKVFEVAIGVHMPDAFMTSYNLLNGAWCAGDEELIQGVLREEWNFDGYVMTDWGSTWCCPPTPTVQAGVSWIAPGAMDDSEVIPLVEAIENGTLDRERVKRNVYDMYKVIAKYYNK